MSKFKVGDIVLYNNSYRGWVPEKIISIDENGNIWSKPINALFGDPVYVSPFYYRLIQKDWD